VTIRLGLKYAFLFPSQISHISRKREVGRPFGLGPTLCGNCHTTHSRKILCMNFRRLITEILRNGYGTMRAAAVTWQYAISPDGRLAELACAGLS